MGKRVLGVLLVFVLLGFAACSRVPRSGAGESFNTAEESPLGGTLRSGGNSFGFADLTLGVQGFGAPTGLAYLSHRPIAVADLNGNGIADAILGTNFGEGSLVSIHLDGSLQPVGNLDPYPGFDGGSFVALADVNNDGLLDIVTGAGQGGGPHVKVLSGVNHAPIRSFFAYNDNFRGGVRVAACDVNDDGYAEVVTAAGLGGGPHLKVFDGRSNAEIHSFFAYTNFTGGFHVACADVNGDGFGDVITGADTDGGPHVRIFNGAQNMAVLDEFFAFSTDYVGGIRVGATDTNGDGSAEVLITTWRYSRPLIVSYHYPTRSLSAEFPVGNASYRSGIYVGGSLGTFPGRWPQSAFYLPLPAAPLALRPRPLHFGVNHEYTSSVFSIGAITRFSTSVRPIGHPDAGAHVGISLYTESGHHLSSVLYGGGGASGSPYYGFIPDVLSDGQTIFSYRRQLFNTTSAIQGIVEECRNDLATGADLGCAEFARTPEPFFFRSAAIAPSGARAAIGTRLVGRNTEIAYRYLDQNGFSGIVRSQVTGILALQKSLLTQQHLILTGSDPGIYSSLPKSSTVFIAPIGQAISMVYELLDPSTGGRIDEILDLHYTPSSNRLLIVARSRTRSQLIQQVYDGPIYLYVLEPGRSPAQLSPHRELPCLDARLSPQAPRPVMVCVGRARDRIVTERLDTVSLTSVETRSFPFLLTTPRVQLTTASQRTQAPSAQAVNFIVEETVFLNAPPVYLPRVRTVLFGQDN